MERGAIRVWLDEGNVIFRRGMANCIEAAGFVVTGGSANLHPSPDLDRVDILVFDVQAAGVPAAVQLVRGTDVRLIGISRLASEELLFHAVEAGIAGFLIRPELTPDSLVGALRAVAGGNGSIPPRVLARLLDDLARAKRPRATIGQLASRELTVLRLLADGGSTREIAHDLSYSERTVKNIVHDTLMKLNCRTRAQAVAVAARQGVI